MKFKLLAVLFITLTTTETLTTNSTKRSALPYSTYGELNSPCTTSRDCKPYGYICKDSKSCQCNYDYVPDHNTKKCLGGVDQKCTYDEHCIKGAYCMNQQMCQCKEDTPYSSQDGLECSTTTIIKPHSSELLYMLAILLWRFQ